MFTVGIMSDREEYHDSHVGDDSEGEEVVFKATSSTMRSPRNQKS